MIRTEGAEVGASCVPPMTSQQVRVLCDRINLTFQRVPKRLRLFSMWIDWDLPSQMCSITVHWAQPVPDACQPGSHTARPQCTQVMPIEELVDERTLVWLVYQMLQRLCLHEIHHWLQLDGVPVVDPTAEEREGTRLNHVPPRGWCPDLAARLAQDPSPPPPKPRVRIPGLAVWREVEHFPAAKAIPAPRVRDLGLVPSVEALPADVLAIGGPVNRPSLRHHMIAWLQGFWCRRRGHRWVEVVNIMCARCCSDCGCGQIVNFVHDGQYRAGPILLIVGRACAHAALLKPKEQVVTP